MASCDDQIQRGSPQAGNLIDVTPATLGVPAIIAVDLTEAAQQAVALDPIADDAIILDVSAADPKDRKVLLADAFHTDIDRVAGGSDLANSAAEQTLYTKTIPGGTLDADRYLRLTIIGRYKNDEGGPATIQFKAKFGGTTHLDDTTAAIASDADERSFQIVLILAAKGNNTTQTIAWTVRISAATTPAAGIGSLSAAPIVDGLMHKDAISIDSTANQTLAITIQHSIADPDTTIQLLSARLELLTGVPS